MLDSEVELTSAAHAGLAQAQVGTRLGQTVHMEIRERMVQLDEALENSQRQHQQVLAWCNRGHHLLALLQGG